MFRSSHVQAARFLAAAINGAIPKIGRDRPAARASIYEPLEPRRLMSVNVTTYRYDNARDGANTNETKLTLANVNTATFGKIASLPVDGQIYAQPLVMTNVAVAGQGTHDVVLVATENDSVYAFDAKGNNPTQGYLWRTSLVQAGETVVPQTDYSTNDITPIIGITGTPVIDPASNTLYVVGAFKEGNGTYVQRLYALDVASGATKFGGPVTITATALNSSGGTVSFSGYYENQRPALTLANGNVYVAFASHGDISPWHGWVIAYNASTLVEQYSLCTTPNGNAGGIWMSGGGLSVDSAGNLYFSTGNGSFDVNTGGNDYAMAIEKVSPTLGVLDYYAPYNEATLSLSDLDYGCSSVIVLPNQGGTAPNELLSASKWGTVFLNNGDTGNIGGFTSNGPNNVLGFANITSNLGTSNLHNAISYWNGEVYVGGDALPLQAFNVVNGTIGGSSNGSVGGTYSSETSTNFGSSAVEDGQGCNPTISSNGSTNGIVWALDNKGFTTSPGVLYAYNASNLGQLLWSSSQSANNRDTAGNAVKFQDTVVANGYVYVGGANSVTIYGSYVASTNTPTLTAAAVATPSTVTGTTTTLSSAATDPAPDLNPVYNWAATTIPTGATAPTFSTNGTNGSNDPAVTFSKAGSYTFTVTISDPNSGLSVTSSVGVTVAQSLTAVTVTPTTVNLNDGATQQLTASGRDQFGTALTIQPTFTWSINSGGPGGTVNASGLYTAPAAGSGIDVITVATGSFSTTATAVVSLPATTLQVNLSGSFNKVGIVADGSTFTGGLDGVGAALSANLLGTSRTFNGSTFSIAASNASNLINNVVSATGQTIAVPQGRDSTIKLLATRTNGSQTDAITFNYTDGTTQTVPQGFSDWYNYTSYTNQSAVVSMRHRDLSTGTNDNRTFYVYGYILSPNNAKTLASITLPGDSQLAILSLDTVGLPAPTVTTPAAANPSPVTGTTAALSVAATDAAGDANPKYTWAATTVPAGAPTPVFSVNGTASANNTTATFYQAGSYVFSVTIADPTNTVFTTTTLAVTVNQTVSSINVTPAGPVTLTNGQTRQFNAAAADQFGQLLVSQPTFTWSVVSPGVGTVDATGLYQGPPTDTGSAIVRAAAAGVAGQSTVQVTLPAWLGTGGTATWNSTSHVLTVTGATSIIADPGTDLPVIQAGGSAAVVSIYPGTGLIVHLGGFNLTNGASVVVASLGASRTATNHRLVIISQPIGTNPPTLSIDPSSWLNLNDNDMNVAGSPLSAVAGLVAQGYAFGNWNGTGGIDSATAAGDSAHLTAVGVIGNNQSGTPLFNSTNPFDSIVPAASDVLVRFTYSGDANLDGKVDGSDYSLIDSGYQANLNQPGSASGWYYGDYNFDGQVDGSDYTLIDNAFNNQGAALSSHATVTAQVAAVTAPVKPSTIVVASLVATTKSATAFFSPTAPLKIGAPATGKRLPVALVATDVRPTATAVHSGKSTSFPAGGPVITSTFPIVLNKLRGTEARVTPTYGTVRIVAGLLD